MKVISKYIAGSISYGTNGPDSDEDIRYCFLNIDISKIIGTDRFEHLDKINPEKKEDNFGFELVSYLKLLRKSNTQCVEMLWNDKWLEIAPEFKLIQDNGRVLIDSEAMFKCLRGYSAGEKHKITGITTGKLGEKRKLMLEKFGYSPSNASHAIRLLRSGILFFRYDDYPVNIVEKDKDYGQLCKDIKLNPQNYNPIEIENLIDNLDKQLEISFQKREVNYTFDNQVANDIIYQCYMPILKEYKCRL
jgi:hypothetical protein